MASVMRAKVVDKLLPAIFFNPELITTLGSKFVSLPDFRTDIAQMASKDVPVAVSAFVDRASCICGPAGTTTIRDEIENGRRYFAREQHGSRRSE